VDPRHYQKASLQFALSAVHYIDNKTTATATTIWQAPVVVAAPDIDDRRTTIAPVIDDGGTTHHTRH
jgi:hypothetical protein